MPAYIYIKSNDSLRTHVGVERLVQYLLAVHACMHPDSHVVHWPWPPYENLISSQLSHLFHLILSVCEATLIDDPWAERQKTQFRAQNRYVRSRVCARANASSSCSIMNTPSSARIYAHTINWININITNHPANSKFQPSNFHTPNYRPVRTKCLT